MKLLSNLKSGGGSTALKTPKIFPSVYSKKIKTLIVNSAANVHVGIFHRINNISPREKRPAI